MKYRFMFFFYKYIDLFGIYGFIWICRSVKDFLIVFYCNVKENDVVCFNFKIGLVESYYFLIVCIGEDLYICLFF